LQQITQGEPYPELDQLLYDLKHGFNTAMEDDLNISAALAAVFKVIKELNRLSVQQAISAEQVPLVLAALKSLDTVLGVFCFEAVYDDPGVQAVINQRAAARKAGNWQLADELRHKLEQMGVQVRDGKI
jgi:cysteinyl-tRNA synthetase